MRTKFGRILLAAVFAFVFGVGTVVAYTVYSFGTTPDFDRMRGSVTVPIKLADGTPSTRVVGPRASGWVPMGGISRFVVGAVVASEDASFYQHDGIDVHEIRAAIKRDWEEKRWARGASTLTQQVVKNVFLSAEKTLTRKVRELLWARELDKRFSKSEILCFYLNLVEWGPGIYGVGNATRYYFGKTPSELTAKEGAFLAMLLPSPIKYGASFRKKELTGYASRRIAQILRIMWRMGFLEDEEYELAQHEGLFGRSAETVASSDDDSVGDETEGSDVTPAPVKTGNALGTAPREATEAPDLLETPTSAP